LPMKAVWDISFTRDNLFDLTGQRDQFRIFATVRQAIIKFLQASNARSIRFSAWKGDGASRVKLYRRLAQQLKPLGWTVTEKDSPDDVLFYAEKK
jgi:hypothetical protein